MEGELEEAPWRRRFRAAANELAAMGVRSSGADHLRIECGWKFEWYGWHARTAFIDSSPTGPPERCQPHSTHPAAELWFFDDAAGNELGRWVRRPLDGGQDREVSLPEAYSTGLALGREAAVVSSGVGGRFSVW